MLIGLLCASDFSINSSTKEWLSKEYVYDKYGCGGKNLSPEISWQNAPKETKSFAITIFDIDTPTDHD